MATAKQRMGEFGEKLVVRTCLCPKCKRVKTLKRLPNNFKCADVVCDFCGYLAQIKTSKSADTKRVPNVILGAAWRTQKERMDAGIYFPLFVVLVAPNGKTASIFYLSADLQKPEMFLPRMPLSQNAKRAGWQGFYYDMGLAQDSLVQIC